MTLRQPSRLRLLWSLIVAAMVLLAAFVPALAREGDTLNPIQVDAPTLEMWPDDLLSENDALSIDGRVREARNSGVPLAVRIIDLTLPNQDLPSQLRSFVRNPSSDPLSEERQAAIGNAWIKSEPIETTRDADDGFLLLVLVPEDRTQTQAIWWVGPNALPLNGLTAENIAATQYVMNAEFGAGNMPNGVYLGVSEFSYNIQFGDPLRLERTTLQAGLNRGLIPLAAIVAVAGLAVPILAIWSSRRTINTTETNHSLSPWEAAALYYGRANQSIPTAMLLASMENGETTSMPGGRLRIEPQAHGRATEALIPFVDTDGILDTQTMYAIESILLPIRKDIENALAEIGAMTADAKVDRARMLLLMGVTGFLVALITVPTVISMSVPGVVGITIAAIGIATGCWWLEYRSFTTPTGKDLLARWLESASQQDRHAYDMAVHLDLITDQSGGPQVDAQTRLARRLRGLGST